MNAALAIPDADLVPQELEAVVIGTVILDAEAIARAARVVKPEHFAIDNHRIIYNACLNLWRNGTGIDLLTVTLALKKSGLLEKVGGPYALVGFTRLVSSSRNLEDHCAIIREHFSLRTLRAAGLQLAQDTNSSEDPDVLISSLTVQVQKASCADVDNDINAGERAFSLMNGGAKPKPIYLGMDGVDGCVFMLDGNMLTVSGPAGTGKTAFVLSATLNLMPTRKPWVVSLEMAADELITRALCQLAMVDIDRAMEGRLTEDERDRMANAATQYAQILSMLDIDDTGTMTIDHFQAKAEHKVKNEGVTLIVIDYAQLMDADVKLHKNKADQFEAISKGIRATGRKLSVPIICVVHVNREGQAHGSTQFEKDAHVRINLFREEGSPNMGVDVVKNRNGRVGKQETPAQLRYGIVGRHGAPHWARTIEQAPF